MYVVATSHLTEIQRPCLPGDTADFVGEYLGFRCVEAVEDGDDLANDCRPEEEDGGGNLRTLRYQHVHQSAGNAGRHGKEDSQVVKVIFLHSSGGEIGEEKGRLADEDDSRHQHRTGQDLQG